MPVLVTSFASHGGASSALPCHRFIVWMQELESARMILKKPHPFFVKDQTQSPAKAAGGFTLISIGTGLGF